MQPLIANPYDRVLSNRLPKRYHRPDIPLTHIALFKINKATLYIGFFDLSKVFDRGSRYLFLKAFVKMGVESVMTTILLFLAQIGNFLEKRMY